MVVAVMGEDDVMAVLSFGESGVARWKEGATKHDEARTSCSREGRGCSSMSTR